MDKVKPTPQERKDATAELRKKHQPIFDALGIPEAIYIPKMAYKPKGLDSIHMGFFESELKHGKDVYTEMVGIMMDSEDPSRTLYKYRGNAHFREELPTSDDELNSSTRYYVPMDELEVVTMPVKRGRGRPRKTPATDIQVKRDQPKAIRTIVVDPTEDLPMDKMTVRDYIAIHTGKPVSTKRWINEIVEN
jgi:hypothetical protein